MWTDAGYDGAPLARWAKTIAAITVEVVKRTSPHSFQVVRRRWVIRLARYETGQPPPRRWGGDRKPPPRTEPAAA
jgi:transposase